MASDGGDSPCNELLNNVTDWLNDEGYPVEFDTAATFRQNHFGVVQGYYVRHSPDDPKREIDVLAHRDGERLEGLPLLRVDHAVECKWSGDRPWVLFCGGHGMTPEACIAQSIGNDLGHTLLWKEAGNDRLTELPMFQHRLEPAFSGRQAFSKSKDVVYDAVRAVVGHAVDVARGYNDSNRHSPDGLSDCAVLVRPMVVVDGLILEARHTPGEGLGLREVQASRLQWRGADDHKYGHATLDVVRLSYLDTFLAERAREADVILDVMKQGAAELAARYAEGSLRDLQVTRGARGMTGVPPYLRRLHRAEADRVALETPSPPPPEEDANGQ